MFKGHILVVEDDKSMAAAIREILEGDGYKVSAVVDSGEEATQIAGSCSQDLVLMDVKLQGKMDGLQAAEIIWDQYQLPVIFLTGNSEKSVLERAKVSMPYGFLLKPFNQKELLITVEIALLRNTLEKQVKASDTKHRTLLASIGSPVLSLRRDMNVLYCNQAFANIVGSSVKEMEDKSISSIIPGFEQTELAAIYCKVLDSGDPQDLVWENDNQYYHVNVYPTDEGILVKLNDITEIKKAEKKLAHDNDLILALGRAAESVLLAETVEGVYRTIGEQIVGLGYNADIFLLIEEESQLQILHQEFEPNLLQYVAERINSPITEHRFPIKPGSLFEQFIAEGKTTFYPSIVSLLAEIHPAMESLQIPAPKVDFPQIISGIIAPLLSAQGMYGLLCVFGFGLSSGDVPAVTIFAGQVSAAIENLHLLEAERLQRELAEAQAEISVLINQSLELEEVLNQILDHVLRVFGFKAANIRLVEGDSLQLAGHRGYDRSDKDIMKRYNFRMDNLPEEVIEMIAKSGGTVVVQDTHNNPEWSPDESFDWLRSYVSIPLKVGEETIGFLSADSEEADRITEDNVSRLKVFADIAATAVHNARLFSDLQTSLAIEKATRQQLTRADKLAGMGRMVASVAHELNNPLQTIKNTLFLVEQSYKLDDDSEMLEMVFSEVDRLSGIVARLRDVYRPRSEEHFGPTPISPLLSDVSLLLETHLNRNDVKLVLDDQYQKSATVEGFSDNLKQVFLNLSLNAIESMQPEGGVLTIHTRLSEDGKEIGVDISDTGSGVSQEVIDLIFDPFYTTKNSGMGLGLSICYDITQNHNGRITVKKNSSQGATFTVWLPLSENQEISL